MNQILQRSRTETSDRVPSTGDAPRFDLYTGIHKALRAFMGDTLLRLGRLDVGDDGECQRCSGQVLALLEQLRSHLRHENDFLHTAIEARRPGGARHTADDHLLHLDAIDDLSDEAQALRDAPAAQRPPLALRLYRHLAVFVGENLEHMQLEEGENHSALWALYSDSELAALHDRLLASIGPAEMALTARWMVVALSVQELAGLFGGLRQTAPAPAFEALFEIARQHMPPPDHARLARALGLPPVAGLMTA